MSNGPGTTEPKLCIADVTGNVSWTLVFSKPAYAIMDFYWKFKGHYHCTCMDEDPSEDNDNRTDTPNGPHDGGTNSGSFTGNIDISMWCNKGDCKYGRDFDEGRWHRTLENCGDGGDFEDSGSFVQDGGGFQWGQNPGRGKNNPSDVDCFLKAAGDDGILDVNLGSEELFNYLWCVRGDRRNTDGWKNLKRELNNLVRAMASSGGPIYESICDKATCTKAVGLG